MTDNVRVALRIRPLNDKEIAETRDKRCIEVISKMNTIVMQTKTGSKSFTYDYVADSDISQEEIFQTLGQPVATYSLLGYNTTLFGYGQTGSGKTYTVIGPNSDLHFKTIHKGLLPRCIEFIFSMIYEEKVKSLDVEYSVMCSFLEIYQENIIDLLDSRPNPPHLNPREDVKTGVYVENLTLSTVQTSGQAIECVKRGLSKRHIASTSMNKESSRAHSVFTIYIQCKEKGGEEVLNIRNSRFHVIDLAGSERQKSTNANGERLKEASAINKSLCVLGNVIYALVEISEGKSRHVHYRNSKLTYLLKDSLGGNSKTTIIATVSPGPCSYGETHSTLMFAQRAKLVKNKAVINEETGGLVMQLRKENKKLKDELCRFRSEKAVSGPCSCDMSLTTSFNFEMSERVNELGNLLSENILIRQRVEYTLQNNIKDRDDLILALRQDIEKLATRISQDESAIKLKEAAIQRYQFSAGIVLPDEYLSLADENRTLREQLHNYTQDIKIRSDFECLKRYAAQLKEELDKSPESVTMRLKDNQEFTARLRASLDKLIKEREAVMKIVEEYQKIKAGESMPSVYKEMNEKLAEELEYYKGLAEEYEISRRQSQYQSQAFVEESDEKMKNLSEELQVCRDNIETLENENSFLKNEMQNINREYRQASEENKRERDSLICQLESFQVLNSQLQAQLLETKAKLDSLDSAYTSVCQVLQDEQQRRRAIDLKISRRSSAHIFKENLPPSEQDLQIHSLTQERSYLYEERDSLHSTIEHYKSLYLSSQQELTNLRSDYSLLLTQSQTVLQEKESSIKELSSQIESYKQDIADYELSLNNLEAHLDSLDKENLSLQDYKDKFEKLTSEKEILEGELRSYKDHLDSIEEENNYFKTQIMNLTVEREQEKNLLEDQLVQSIKECDHLKQETEKYRKLYYDASGHLNNNQKIKVHENLKSDLNNEKRKNAWLMKKVEKLEEELNKYKARYGSIV